MTPEDQRFWARKQDGETGTAFSRFLAGCESFADACARFADTILDGRRVVPAVDAQEQRELEAKAAAWDTLLERVHERGSVSEDDLLELLTELRADLKRHGAP